MYVGAMNKIRGALDAVLASTSRPLQTVGGVNKIASEARAKYQRIGGSILKVKWPYPLIPPPPQAAAETRD
jgi:hypothetical protein